MTERNVLGGPLEPCGTDPLTGFYRDGDCACGPEDVGLHAICAVMTEEFLAHQRSVGNDLSTPRPEWHFAGLAARRPVVRRRRALAAVVRRRRRRPRHPGRHQRPRPRGRPHRAPPRAVRRRPRGPRLARVTAAGGSRGHPRSFPEPSHPLQRGRAGRAASLTDVNAAVRTEGLTKDYGPVLALDALTVDVGDGITGLVGANGAGQVDADQDPARPGAADRRQRAGARPRHRHRRRGDPGGGRLPAGARLPAARRQRERLRRPPRDDVGPAARGRPRAGGRGAAPRGPGRGALPADGRLLHRHEAEGQARAGARPRPPAGLPRRAHQRPRPGGP